MMTAKVEIYGTSDCSKCTSVRAFFDEKNIAYTDYFIDLMAHDKDEMIRRSGLKYYPQIFINDKYIGGEDDLLMLDYTGDLEKLLNTEG